MIDPTPDRSLLAVVGAGYWGRNLVRNLAQMGQLGAVVDASPEVRATMAQAYPGVPVTADLDVVLGERALGGCMVAVPSSRHFAVARRCLEAGKHTYVEKPIAQTVSDGEALVRLADERGLRLMVGHLLIYHPCVQWLRDHLTAGGIGDVLYLNSVRSNLGKVRSDENCMWSLAPHDVSVAIHLLGEMPTHVAAQGMTYVQRGAGIEDVVFLTLRFPDGRGAQIHVSWLDPHKKRQLTVVGARKMVTFDDMAPTEKVRVYDKGVDRAEVLGDAPTYASYGDLLTLREGDIHIPTIPMREPLRALCEHFANVVATGAAPLTDGRAGVDVVRVLQAGQQSLQAGGVPVALSPHPGGLRGHDTDRQGVEA